MARKFPNRLLPGWAHYAGTAIDEGGIVLLYCPRCGHIFRVSLELMVHVRGRQFLLLNKRPLCRIAKCGGRGFYVAAPRPENRLVPVLQDLPDDWIMGPRPLDFEPGPPDPPPAPEPPPRWITARRSAK
ncbi:MULTISPECIES: hypothetical protein [Pacificimonas]|nr:MULTISPECIES: hypothetical protein [Pacificimonas]MBZ6379082.1 hypothetical protein [Pacificimonas aurantium]